MLWQKSGKSDKKQNNKPQEHGDESDASQLGRREFSKLPEPSLHGFGRGCIGQSLEDQNKSNQGKQYLHVPHRNRMSQAMQRPQTNALTTLKKATNFEMKFTQENTLHPRKRLAIFS